MLKITTQSGNINLFIKWEMQRWEYLMNYKTHYDVKGTECTRRKKATASKTQVTQQFQLRLELKFKHTNSSSSLQASEIWTAYYRNPTLKVTIQ